MLVGILASDWLVGCGPFGVVLYLMGWSVFAGTDAVVGCNVEGW